MRRTATSVLAELGLSGIVAGGSGSQQSGGHPWYHARTHLLSPSSVDPVYKTSDAQNGWLVRCGKHMITLAGRYK
jgi:hypothetical protein